MHEKREFWSIAPLEWDELVVLRLAAEAYLKSRDLDYRKQEVLWTAIRKLFMHSRVVNKPDSKNPTISSLADLV